MTHRYGLIKDTPNLADRLYHRVAPRLAQLPAQVDLSPWLGPVKNQEQFGCCTGEAISGLREWWLKKEPDHPFVTLSPLYLYAWERVAEGTFPRDAGAQPRDGMIALQTHGVCPDALDPLSQADLVTMPSTAANTAAQTYRLGVPHRVSGVPDLLQALANGHPVVAGIPVYASFESAEVAATGAVPMPQPGETVLGGHAVLIYGYTMGAQLVQVRNSWGPAWGVQGNFTLPFQYVAQLAWDLWTLIPV